jgi:hypothetical protein
MGAIVNGRGIFLRARMRGKGSGGMSKVYGDSLSMERVWKTYGIHMGSERVGIERLMGVSP